MAVKPIDRFSVNFSSDSGQSALPRPEPTAANENALHETRSLEFPPLPESANIPRLTNWLQYQTNGLDLARTSGVLPSPFPSSTLSPFADIQPYDVQSIRSANTDFSFDREHARSLLAVPSAPVTPAHIENRSSFQDSCNTSHLSTTTSIASHGPNEGGDGVLYVDGERARQPRQRKRLMLPPERSPVVSKFSLSFDARNVPPRVPGKAHVADEPYRWLCRYFETLCVNSSIMFEKFVTPDFPPQELLSVLLDSYFDHFADVLPFIHQPTFNGSSKHFALLLAMATLGGYFFGHGMDNQFCMSLREFLRRIMWALHDPPADVKPLSTHEAARIQLLYAVAVRHSTRPFESALQNAISYCSLSWPNVRKHTETATPTSKADWMAWVEREEAIRTQFSIWLVDAVFSSHAERTPSFKLGIAVDSQLPCTESLWAAEDHVTWAASRTSHPSAPSLQSTLQSLYVDKRLPSNLGEYARVITIHGIYHRTWDVREYWQQTLSHFEPSAPRQDATDNRSPAPIWHSSMDVPNRWRNAALDCLDILHWNANALIGLAHGMEHPTVLHLHFARVALLSPLTNIIRLAKYTSGVLLEVHGPDADVIKEDLSIIRQWVVQDQYKARLAAIHAGALFWHVRRFSTDAFYEPDTVALATLMLWAISKFLPNRQKSKDATTDKEPLDADDPQIVLLDRPIDDELVQQFVREGYSMHVNMTGVGNLFGTHGPQRVLVEGQKLLATLGAWQDGKHRWTNILSRLEKVRRNEIIRT